MKTNPCRYCFYGVERNGKYKPSHRRSECYDCKNLEKHKEYLKSHRKYKIGQPITSIDELMNQKYIYMVHGMSEKIYHHGFFGSWQLRYAKGLINQRHLYTAVPNDSEQQKLMEMFDDEY